MQPAFQANSIALTGVLQADASGFKSFSIPPSELQLVPVLSGAEAPISADFSTKQSERREAPCFAALMES